MYEMFLGPLESEKPWSVSAIKGIDRFLNRVYNLAQRLKKQKTRTKKVDKDTELALSELVYAVTDGISKMRFNTVISKMMVFEDMLRAKIVKESNFYYKEVLLTFIKLLFPFAPHFSQEVWNLLGKKTLIDLEPWPKYNSKLLQKKVFEYVIQINGKKRGSFQSDKESLSEKDIKKIVQDLPLYEKYIKNKKIMKIIFVKGKLVNFVVK
jgi:leucyl-tRNA synthetase